MVKKNKINLWYTWYHNMYGSPGLETSVLINTGSQINAGL